MDTEAYPFGGLLELKLPCDVPITEVREWFLGQVLGNPVPLSEGVEKELSRKTKIYEQLKDGKECPKYRHECHLRRLRGPITCSGCHEKTDGLSFYCKKHKFRLQESCLLRHLGCCYEAVEAGAVKPTFRLTQKAFTQHTQRTEEEQDLSPNRDSSPLPDVTFIWLYNWLGCSADVWHRLKSFTRHDLLTYHRRRDINQYPFNEAVRYVQVLIFFVQKRKLFLGYSANSAVKKLRKDGGSGTFMIRLSATKPGYLAATVMHTPKSVISHRIRILEKGYLWELVDKKKMPTIDPAHLEDLCEDPSSYLSELPHACKAEFLKLLSAPVAPKLVYKSKKALYTCLHTTGAAGVDVNPSYLEHYATFHNHNTHS